MTLGIALLRCVGSTDFARRILPTEWEAGLGPRGGKPGVRSRAPGAPAERKARHQSLPQLPPHGPSALTGPRLLGRSTDLGAR